MKGNKVSNKKNSKSQKVLAMILAILMVAGMATTTIAVILDAFIH